METEELSDIVGSTETKFKDVSQRIYLSLKCHLDYAKDWVINHPIETGIIGIDILALGLFLGRARYGFDVSPDNKIAKFLLSDTFPHIVLGVAPVTTMFYILRRKWSLHPLISLFSGVIIASYPFYREFIQKAKDSLSDSISTAIGISTGLLFCYFIHNYITRNYNSNPD